MGIRLRSYHNLAWLTHRILQFTVLPQDPFIVYTSNMWAIFNLRSMFTLLANAVEDLQYLRPAVAIVLAFVGVKLGVEYVGYDVPTTMSLGVISAILGSGIGLSLYTADDKF